jgi:hypothetical protein
VKLKKNNVFIQGRSSSGFRSKKLHTLIFKGWIKSYLHVYVITILLNVIKGGELKVPAAQGI